MSFLTDMYVWDKMMHETVPPRLTMHSSYLKFVGQDSNNPAWAFPIKHGHNYSVNVQNHINGVTAYIFNDFNQCDVCPYDSMESFMQNWEFAEYKRTNVQQKAKGKE